MLAFFQQNLATLLVGAVVLAVIVLALVRTRKEAKAGGCCGGCTGCSMSGTCGGQKE